MRAEITIGQTVVCHETGKQFIAALAGITTNYALDNEGHVFSDEGVDIREKRELLDRSKPFCCYVSSDGKTITGWKGNKLGDIVHIYQTNSGFGSWRRGGGQWYVSARDVHGNYWYGRGAGKGMCITLRPKKGA